MQLVRQEQSTFVPHSPSRQQYSFPCKQTWKDVYLCIPITSMTSPLNKNTTNSDTKTSGHEISDSTDIIVGFVFDKIDTNGKILFQRRQIQLRFTSPKIHHQ